ncbi:hypothetical protein AAC387_Pa05g2205 [Persea americana]
MEAKGGEIRRVHIIYFLSRMGRIEHPHLIRVNHMNRSGVHLRDVKRWLSDLRGKGMPDSFSWSYKRRYKTGYVWQDLMDDDLITPISDNEYVLKGSEISAFCFDPSATVEKTDSILKPAPVEDKTAQCNGKKDADISDKPIETEKVQEEYVKRTLSFKLEEEEDDEKVLESEAGKEDLESSFLDSSFVSAAAAKEEEGLKKTTNKEEKRERTPSKNKSSNGASHVFRNILTCGAVDTKDSAVRPINRRSKVASRVENKGEICKAEGVGGSQRVFGGSWNRQQQLPQSTRKSFDGTKGSKKNSSINQKQVSTASRPVAEPNCSQCGKAFKPEKLHSHMKSCRALKNRGAKGGPAAAQKLPHTAAAKDELRTTISTKGSSPGLIVRPHSLHHKSHN